MVTGFLAPAIVSGRAKLLFLDLQQSDNFAYTPIPSVQKYIGEIIMNIFCGSTENVVQYSILKRHLSKSVFCRNKFFYFSLLFFLFQKDCRLQCSIFQWCGKHIFTYFFSAWEFGEFWLLNLNWVSNSKCRTKINPKLAFVTVTLHRIFILQKLYTGGAQYVGKHCGNIGATHHLTTGQAYLRIPLYSSAGF